MSIHEPPTVPAPSTRPDRWWIAALVASGALLLVGGPMHPEAPSDLSLREELAIMMDDGAWIPGHTLVMVAAVLLAVGLWRVRRSGAWPARARGALRAASVAYGLYAIETLFHLVAFVDADRLRDGDFAPVAFTHLGLALVVYPASGVALAYLAWRLLPTWTAAQRVFAVGGIVGGIAHAASVPAVFLLPDTETGGLFAVGGIGVALWSITAGIAGLRRSPTPQPDPQPLVAEHA